MNVCLVTPTFLPKIGGVETVVSSLAKHYCELAVPTCVVTQWPRRGKGIPDDRLLPYPVIRYKRPWSFTWSIALRRIYKALDEAHRRYQFHLIHCHLVYPVGYVALRFAQDHGLPIVLTPHGSDIRAGGRYRKNKTIWTRILTTFQQTDLLTAISEPMHQLMAEVLNGTPKEITVVPNGVDIDELTAPADYHVDWPIAATRDFVLYLGGLSRKKGVDILLHAVKINQTRTQDIPDLVIAGDGPERSALQRYARENRLAPSVRFVGAVSGEFKRYLLQNCRYVVMPSRTEAMPLVALEAFACGKAILAAAVTGLKELVQDDVTGKLVPPENPAALAEAMIRFHHADHGALRQRVQEEAQKYAWPVIARRYLCAYEKILAAPRPSRP